MADQRTIYSVDVHDRSAGPVAEVFRAVLTAVRADAGSFTIVSLVSDDVPPAVVRAHRLLLTTAASGGDPQGPVEHPTVDDATWQALMTVAPFVSEGQVLPSDDSDSWFLVWFRDAGDSLLVAADDRQHARLVEQLRSGVVVPLRDVHAVRDDDDGQVRGAGRAGRGSWINRLFG